MMILSDLGNYQPLARLQTWMLERLVAAQLGSTDLRWSLLALFLNFLTVTWRFGRRRFVLPRACAASRSGRAVATMVAAAFR